MAELVVYSGTADGHVSSSDDGASDYPIAYEGGTLVADAASATLSIGQQGVSPFVVYEGFLSFDISAIPAGATIDAVELALYGQADNSTTDFTIQARTYDWGAGLTIADWRGGGSLSGLTLLATFATAGFSTSGYNAFTESGTALRDAVSAALAGSGVVYVLLCSSRHASNTEPTGDEYVTVYSADQAGTTNDPKLTITYTPPATGHPARSRLRGSVEPTGAARIGRGW